MTHNINEIDEMIKEIMLTTPNITSVSYGHKIANGQQTGDLSIVISVKEKKPLSELSPEEVIPSEIMLSTGPIKTDVKVISEVRTLACNANCGQNGGPNSAVNRSVVRPLKGGASMTSGNLISFVGTLGFIAVHTETQALVGITNNHVTIQDAFYTYQRNLSGPIENEYAPPDYVYQNGENGFIPPPSYQIGQSLRYVPINQIGSGSNTVDAAMFSIEQEDVDITVSFKQIGEEAYPLPYPFATTAEIDNLLVTNPMLYSSGRTTGPKGGVSCPMRVSSINSAFFIFYTKQGVSQNTFYTNAIEFVKPENDPSLATICPNPIIPGDSGSALIADFGGVRKIIGLVFAAGGGTDILYGYACRIDEVASQLGIEAWDGTAKNFIDPSTIEYITTPGGSGTKVLTCDGKDYWQVGLTNISNACPSTTTSTTTTTTTQSNISKPIFLAGDLNPPTPNQQGNQTNSRVWEYNPATDTYQSISVTNMVQNGIDIAHTENKMFIPVINVVETLLYQWDYNPNTLTATNRILHTIPFPISPAICAIADDIVVFAENTTPGEVSIWEFNITSNLINFKFKITGITEVIGDLIITNNPSKKLIVNVRQPDTIAYLRQYSYPTGTLEFNIDCNAASNNLGISWGMFEYNSEFYYTTQQSWNICKLKTTTPYNELSAVSYNPNPGNTGWIVGASSIPSVNLVNIS